MSRHEDYDHLFKIVMIGDSGVGKTNLLSRFVDGTFNVDSKPTIGVEFATKTVVVQGKSVKNQIWDTAGQQRFRAITNAYYRGAVGAILAFDLTKSRTFENVTKWLAQLRENAESDIVIMLLGNKSDLDSREVKQESVEDYVNKHKLLYLETSAANGSNVQTAFNQLIQVICDQKKTIPEPTKLIEENKKPISSDGTTPSTPTKNSQTVKVRNVPTSEAKPKKKACC